MDGRQAHVRSCNASSTLKLGYVSAIRPLGAGRDECCASHERPTPPSPAAVPPNPAMPRSYSNYHDKRRPGVNLFNSSGHGDGGGVPSDGGEEGGVLPSDALNRMMSLSRIAPVLLVRPGV